MQVCRKIGHDGLDRAVFRELSLHNRPQSIHHKRSHILLEPTSLQDKKKSPNKAEFSNSLPDVEPLEATGLQNHYEMF